MHAAADTTNGAGLACDVSGKDAALNLRLGGVAFLIIGARSHRACDATRGTAPAFNMSSSDASAHKALLLHESHDASGMDHTVVDAASAGASLDDSRFHDACNASHT